MVYAQVSRDLLYCRIYLEEEEEEESTESIVKYHQEQYESDQIIHG